MKSIDKFFNCVESLKRSIENIDSTENKVFFQHLACVASLDTLAKCVADSKSKSGERFTTFIKKYCEWDDWNKVSLPHLVKCIELKQWAKHNDLRNNYHAKLKQINSDDGYYIDSDPDYDNVLKDCPKDIKEKCLKKLTHLELFWKYRNSIVHELILNESELNKSRNKPYYEWMHNEDNSDGTWILVYPLSFVLNLISCGMKNLRKYCEENQLDPYEYYNLSGYLINECK